MIDTMITSSVLIVVIIAIRYLFAGKINRRLQYALWGLVLLRLCLPFTLFSSSISVMNAVSIDEIQYVTNATEVQMGTLQEDSKEQSPEQSPVEDDIKTSGRIDTGLELKNNQNTSTTLVDILKKVWIIGGIAIGLWFSGTNLRFYLQLRNSRKLYDKIGSKLPLYLTEGIASPCLFGTLRPAIYLTPKAIENDEMLQYVITHEICHYRHGDYIWSILRGLCLAIYWWNPLIWAAAILSRADSEFACDEAVIKKIGENNRLAYGRTLIDMIAVRRAPSGLMCVATAMSSRKRGIKQRLNIIINNSKTYSFALIIVLIIVFVCVGCTFSGAQENSNIPEAKGGVSDDVQENNAVIDGGEGKSENVTVSIDRTSLDACITDAIILGYTNQNQFGDLDTEAHTVLKTVESGNTTTVYAMALHMLFGYAGGGFSEISSSHMPVAITFEMNTKGEYELKDYWDGSYHDPSIEEKFPADIYEDTQNYVLTHIQTCYVKAVEYGDVDTNAEIEKLFETITSSPAEASNPGAYIEEHPIEYNKLLYYGDYTLRYVFAEFLEGNQTGLKGHIMLAAMRDLIGSEDYTIEADAPQQWFDEWKDNAVRMCDVNSMEYMEKNNPKAYILLQMIMK
ncbi:MAG TPA: M56 family metallopeptidase [Mobilitalea sp.]|nr:M56 family metallopeptidase [Mobilitalea sp.]